MKQRLTMQQPKGRMLQCRHLHAPQPAIRELAHQIRMLGLPQRPNSRVLEDTARNELLVLVGTYQSGLHAISGLAHESRVTDGMAEHTYLLQTRFCQTSRSVKALPSDDTATSMRAHPFSARTRAQEALERPLQSPISARLTWGVCRPLQRTNDARPVGSTVTRSFEQPGPARSRVRGHLNGQRALNGQGKWPGT